MTVAPGSAAAGGGTLLALALLLTGCGEDPARRTAASDLRPLVVVGIDGADWGIVRQLWSAGRLPALREIAATGVTASLGTAYGASPVIWTTVATGRRPPEHGITGFVVPTASGDVPVSSAVRRVPALWNMATTGRRSVAVIGWWASWPAEAVDGVVVSDRALLPVDDAVHPPEFAGRFAALVEAARARPTAFGGNPAARDRDRVTAEVAADLLRDPPTLTLAYFRGVDIASHFHWKHVRPAAFGLAEDAIDPRRRDELLAVYEATDEAIGRMRQAAPHANFMVLSDHGFHAARRPQTRVVLDLDRLLERLGLLARRNGEVDPVRSLAHTQGSAPAENPKRLRLADDPTGETRRLVERRLGAVTYAGGEPVLALRAPRPREVAEGVDLVARVLPAGATRQVVIDGEPHDDVVSEIVEISGTHGPHTAGIFLAAGPDVDPAAALDGISIHDIAPTVLFAIGLPVGEDFAGTARQELFRPELRRRRPLRTIPSWGTIEPSGARPSGADRELVDELRSLGYLR